MKTKLLVTAAILGVLGILWALYQFVIVPIMRKNIVATATAEVPTSTATETKKPKPESFKSALSAPVVPLIVRVDSAGNGHFESSRGSREHKGVDFRVAKGQTVFSPVDGLVERFSYPYASDKKWKGLYIKGNEGIDIKIFYIEPTENIVGKQVRKGDVIGVAQKISDKYNPKMLDHVHVETWVKGAAVNPEPLFGITA